MLTVLLQLTVSGPPHVNIQSFQLAFTHYLGLHTQVQFAKVDASYRFYVRAHTYCNPNQQTSNGNCCDICWFDECDNYFEFCLRSRGTAMSSSFCTLGLYTSQGSITSDDSTFESLIGNLDNPLVYTGNNWPVSVIVDIY